MDYGKATMARHRRIRNMTALTTKANFFWWLAAAISSLPLIHSATDFSHPNATVTKIAFGSCHNSKHVLKAAAKQVDSKDQSQFVVSNVWQRIAEENASVWLWTGDAIYPPLKGIASVEQLRDEYNKMKENPLIGYGDYKPKYMYGTWDDHDYGGNDLGKEMPNKQERADAFFEFLNLPRPNGHNRLGVYSSVSFGEAPNQIKVILLDTRWHREDHCVPSVASKIPILGAGIACVTRWLSAGLVPNLCGAAAGAGTTAGTSKAPSRLLGDAQWAWLEEELGQSPAAIHVIVSSIQVLTTNPVMESWGHFPSERARLLRLLSQTPGAVILSGDVHYSEILSPSVHLDEDGSPDRTMHSPINSFFEVTASGLTHTCKNAIYGALCEPLLETFHKHRSLENKKDYYFRPNFGTLVIDWDKRSMQVSIHDSQTGKIVLTTNFRSFDQQYQWTQQELDGIIPCMDGHLVPLAKTVAMAGVLALLLLWFAGRGTQPR